MALTNKQIAAVFDEIADMLEIKGETIHRVLAYRNAAEAIADHPYDITTLAAAGDLGSIPHVGKIIAEKITELLTTDHMAFYDQLRAEIPAGVVTMLKISGVGAKKARLFWEQGKITTIDALETAARAGQLRGLPGMGAKSEAKILEGIDAHKRRASDTRTLVGVALPIAESILEGLLALPGVIRGTVAGSIRRGKPLIGDVDLLIAAEGDPQPIMSAFVADPRVARILAQGASKSSVELHTGLQVDVRVITPDRWGTALQYFTGSQQHNIRIRERALARGLSLNEHALTPVDDKGQPTGAPPILCADEDAVYAAVGLPYIPPELREDHGEIAAAERDDLPLLITVEDIHADLHMHTTWSDGAHSIREMAEAALALGRRFIVITDHSQSATVANGLSIARLMAQQEQVRRVDAEMGGAIRVFHGSEVEIRADGTLDFPDEVLAQLDFVVASLHVALRQPRDQITARLLNVIANPHVHLIGHPRGGLLLQRDPADLDMEQVFNAARDRGIAFEINASYHRLDLESGLARQAVAMGIPLAIDTDAHHIDELRQMRYGVMTARHGWVTAASVLNTWSLEEFLGWRDARAGRAKG